MSKELEIFDSIIDMLGSCCCIKEIEPKSNDYTVDKFMGYPIEKLRNIFKAMDIIKEKRVDISLLLGSSDLETYNLYIYSRKHGGLIDYKLTQTEYNLLKEVLL